MTIPRLSTRIRFVTTLLISSTVTALSGCGSGPSPARGAVDRSDSGALEPPANSAQVPEIACEGLEWSILAADPTRASLRDRYGRPDSMLSATEPNRHVQGAVDSLFAVYYPGLVAQIRTPTGGGDLVSGVTITDNRYISEPRVGVGATVAEVVAALGEPTRREPGALIYDCGIGAEQPVTFELLDGTVHTISIAYYVD